MTMKTWWLQTDGTQQKQFEDRRLYSNTILLQERRKISNKQHNIKPKATRERTNKIHSWQKKRNHKNESRNKQNREELERINEAKSWFFEKI